jgi:CSLREA domain-containing protein
MRAKTILILLALIVATFVIAGVIDTTTSEAGGGIFLVNATDDSDDGVCDGNHCSLREAINEINKYLGGQEIHFDIPGAGPHHIALCHSLPIIYDDGEVIDGATEPNYGGAPVVVVEPIFTPSEVPYFIYQPCGGVSTGLWIEASDTIVRGLSLVGFDTQFQFYTPAAIVINSGQNNLIEDNYLGIEPNGNIRGNRIGVLIGSGGQTVQDNVISGNGIGVHISAPGQIIQGNFIGTNQAGDTWIAAYGNEKGILLEPWAHQVLIGGSGPDEGNVISWNSEYGIHIQSDDNTVQGNKIGTNLAGDTKHPNQNGILVEGELNLIGGAASGEGNLISGNRDTGVIIQSNTNTIKGNVIGADLSGTAAIPNLYNGVHVFGDDNVIGGAASGEGNLISGNLYVGIYFEPGADGNTVMGNAIGTDPSGSIPLGNYYGIRIDGSDNVIGGIGQGQGNLISYNDYFGVYVKESSGASSNQIIGNTINLNGDDGIYKDVLSIGLGNTFSQNQIFGNDELGIEDFPPVGVDTTGYPVFTSVGQNSVSGSACPGCLVEVFISDDDPSGYGEGMTFIGDAVADSLGNFTVGSLMFPVVICDTITGTATDAGGNTSEFAENQRVGLCVVLDFPWFILVAIFVIGGGVLLGSIFFRRRRGPTPAVTAAGGAIGGLIGGGLLLTALLLPNVVLFIPGEGEQGEESPDCMEFLSSEMMPPDGAVFDTYDNPEFKWEVIGDLPDHFARWRLELVGPGGLHLNRTTTETSMKFSAFELSPSSGDVYAWRLGGEQVGDDGRFTDLCLRPWRRFQMGPGSEAGRPPWTREPSDTPTVTPTVTPTPTETPTPTRETTIITAIMDLTCRDGTYREHRARGYLMEGESAEVLAVNSDRTHGLIATPLGRGTCWVWLGGTEGDTSGASVTRTPPPPTPTPTTLVCKEDLPKDLCTQSGGKWIESLTRAPYCDCTK